MTDVRDRRTDRARPMRDRVAPVAVGRRAASPRSRRLPAASASGDRRRRRQGAARPDARPARVRDPDLYLVLLGGFAWMVELIMERTLLDRLRGQSAAFASASIGQGIFAALLMLETLQVVVPRPDRRPPARSASNARSRPSSCSSATPISSLAIVVGKLLSALVYVWLLIAASIPLTAVVFVYGGVAPDDVLRGYIVLIVTALGFGAFGLFCSSLVKRTQAATAITIFGVLFLTHRDALRPRLLAGPGASTTTAAGVGPIKGSPPQVARLPQPVPRPGRRPVRHRDAFGGWCALGSDLAPTTTGSSSVDDVRRPNPSRSSRNGAAQRRRRRRSATGRSSSIQADRRSSPSNAGGGWRRSAEPGPVAGPERRRPVRGRPRHALDEERRDLAGPVRHVPRRCRSSSCRRPGAGGSGAVAPSRSRLMATAVMASPRRARRRASRRGPPDRTGRPGRSRPPC